MEAFGAILLCALSVLGLYAVFSRLAVLLSPHGSLSLTVDGRGKQVDEILLSLETARLLLEREAVFSRRVTVLLEAGEELTAEKLARMGVYACIVKK